MIQKFLDQSGINFDQPLYLLFINIEKGTFFVEKM